MQAIKAQSDGQPLDPRQSIAVAQPEAPAEPSGWQLNAITHVAAWLGDLQDVPRDASYWTNGRFAADCMDAHDVLLAAPAAQQPAELTEIATVVDDPHFHDHWRLKILGHTVAGDTGWSAHKAFQAIAEDINSAAAERSAIKAQGGSQ
jgi:hypothetical protein